MAAAIRALNAKIRANPTADYFCSTHFWGPASNFGIPIAAIMDTQKDPEIISGRMTAALSLYSGTFMRYALAVTPKNYLLFGCHFINFGSQLTQGYRYLNYWNWGGREKALASSAKIQGSEMKKEAIGLVNQAKDGLSAAEAKVQEGVSKVMGK